MFIVKVAIACGLALLLLRGVTVRKTTVFFLLFVLWSLAFIYSPYWHAFGAFGFPYLRYVSLALLGLSGLAWAYFSSSEVKVPKIKIEFLPLLLLGLMLFVVNVNPLKADIAWRGDEDFHINLLLQLINYFSFFWARKQIYVVQNPLFWTFLLLMLLLVSLLIIYRVKSNARLKRVVHGCAVGIGMVLIPFPALILFSHNAFGDQRDLFLLSDLLRYPFIQKWINLIFVAPDFYHDIKLYRMVPFLSLLAISILLYYFFNQKLKSKLLSLLFSFSFSTVPLILFYSNILYLEMPIIFLMLVLTFNLRIILKEDSDRLKSHYVWYGLLLMAFLKETAFMFLLLIILLRIGYQLFIYYKAKGILKPLLSEINLSILILGPGFIYLLLRQIFLPRPYTFYVKNILAISNYVGVLQAFSMQVGLLFVIGTLGLVFLLRKKYMVAFIPLTFLLLGMLLFFLGYQYRGYVESNQATLFVGYSRWNLYLLPMIIFAGFYFITQMKFTYRIILLCALLISNMVLFPFKSDGARMPNWGSPHSDTAEYTYPYDETIRFLSGQRKTSTLLLLGQYSPYWGLRFYFEKYNFYPKTIEYPFDKLRFDTQKEHQMLDSFFVKLAHQQLDKKFLSADAILYHSVNGIDLDMDAFYGGKYKIVKSVKNSLHSIYIFKKT